MRSCTLPFLNYQIIVVAGPGHPLAKVPTRPAQLREQVWLLGPSAAGDDGIATTMLRRFDVPEERQRIFQSHAAAIEESMHNEGLALALSWAVTDDLAHGRLVRIEGPGVQADGVWSAMTLAEPQRDAGGRRADPFHHDPSGDPGDSAWLGHQHRTLPPVGARHFVELSDYAALAGSVVRSGRGRSSLDPTMADTTSARERIVLAGSRSST